MATFNAADIMTVRATSKAAKAASGVANLADRLIAVREMVGDIPGLTDLIEVIINAGDSLSALSSIDPSDYIDVGAARAHISVGREMSAILSTLRGGISFGQTMPEVSRVRSVAVANIAARDEAKKEAAVEAARLRREAKAKKEAELIALFF